MSHYTKVCTKLKSRSAIVKALGKMGFSSAAIEVSDQKMFLKGYTGDRRNQEANIRIKGAGWGNQNAVGSASNDLGWELQEDGTYTMHLSEYDSCKYNTAWQGKFLQQYGKAVIEEVCQEQGLYLSEEIQEINGELYLTANSYF